MKPKLQSTLAIWIINKEVIFLRHCLYGLISESFFIYHHKQINK